LTKARRSDKFNKLIFIPFESMIKPNLSRGKDGKPTGLELRWPRLPTDCANIAG
jgi:hypothetical protein